MTVQRDIHVPIDQYIEILGFATYTYLTGKISKYSGIAGGRTRTLGEYIENFIYGKVAEIAFKLFIEKNFGMKTLTELDIADFYKGTYLPDIVAYEKAGNWIPAVFWIDVKEVRRDQKWMLITESSVKKRPYDAYVAVRVGLPDEHFMWFEKNTSIINKKMSEEWLKKVKKFERDINKIPCKIWGFATSQEVKYIKVRTDRKLTKKGGYYYDGETKVFDPADSSWSGAKVAKNYGFYQDNLEEKSDWKKFSSLISADKRIISKVPMPLTKEGKLNKTFGLPEKYNRFNNFRNGYQAYFTDQLNDINSKFSGIERSSSWFSYSLD